MILVSHACKDFRSHLIFLIIDLLPAYRDLPIMVSLCYAACMHAVLKDLTHYTQLAS